VCADVEATVNSPFTDPSATTNKPTNPFTNSSTKEHISIASPSDFIEEIGKLVPLFLLLFPTAVYMLFFV
jgi:hypothetical protein